MNTRAQIIRELDKKYNAYCEKKVKETWESAIEKAVAIAYNFSDDPIARSIAAAIYKLKIQK